jgi:hypothetical protein
MNNIVRLRPDVTELDIAMDPSRAAASTSPCEVDGGRGLALRSGIV